MLISAFLDPQEPSRDAVMRVGVMLLALAALFQVADALQVMALGLLRGVQDTRVPMIYATFSYWLVGMPASYVLGFPLGYGAAGVWIGLVLGLLCAAVLMLGRFWGRSVRIGVAKSMPA
jgi:multidrug resistance protein, MATE family